MRISCFPPSLSLDGGIRACVKSDLASIPENVADGSDDFTGQYDAIVFNGATLINMLHQEHQKYLENTAHVNFNSTPQNKLITWL